MMSMVFSDDEDVSTHAAALEQVHTSILSKPQSPAANEINGKENLSRSVFKNDPVSLRVLADKNRSPGDVFITPMVTPSKLHDVYELPSDSDPEEISSVQPVSCTFANRHSDSEGSTLRGLTENISPLKFSTPRLSHRRSAIQPSQSDDDVEYTPKTRTYDHESSSGERTVFTMRLRPRRGLWVPEDDLPLAELKPRPSTIIRNKPDGIFNENSQEMKPVANDLNHLKSPSSLFCSILKTELMEIRGHLTSAKGSSLDNGTNQELVLTPCAEAKSREGTRRNKKSRLDDDYRGPDDDVLLIEIKQRRSTLRSSRKDMSRGQVLSSDMD